MDLLNPNCINSLSISTNNHQRSREYRNGASKSQIRRFSTTTTIRRSGRFSVSNMAVTTASETAVNGAARTSRSNLVDKSSSAMELLDIERGVCVPFRKYTPETVRNKVLESRGAILSLASRGVEIVWNLGLYWSALTYDFLVGRDEEVVADRARQLRNLLCNLGPSFIKAGQVLANRPDIIREDYMSELCILQDDVPPFPNQVAFNIIEEELGRPLEAVFTKISSQTIAAASLGQVYRATLRDTGEDVAIKVQRPQIEPIIYRDLFLFRTLASFLNGISLQKLGCNAELIVDEFGEKLLEELDYTLEARNIEDFLENFKDDPTVKIPRVYKQLSGSRVLVMEWIDGIRCTDPQAIKRAGIDIGGFLTVGVSAALRQLLEFGLFHGDPHPGNIFAMRDGRIAYVDFGNVAELSQQNKQILIDAVVHAVNEDYVEMANDFTRLGFLAKGTDVSPIVPALEAIWQNSSGKGLSDFNFRSVTGQFNTLVYNYPIRIPERFSLVIRSLLTQEGICFTLKPDFKFLEVAYPYVAKRLLTDPNPALRERLIQVLFKDGVFQWKRLENLIVLAKENVAKMSSNPAIQVKSISKSLQVEKKLDLTDTIKDGARLFFTDEGIRRKLLLALTEDSKLHVQELVDVYRLVESDIDMPTVAVEVVRDLPTVVLNIKHSSSLVSVSLPFTSQATVFMSEKANQNRRFYAAVTVYRTMPRKINYEIGDYDEDYDDDYGDYEDDDYQVEEHGKVPEYKEETVNSRLWSCSICTYDNDEGMSVCDICGVIRNPLVNVSSNSNNNTAPFKFDVPSPDDVVSNGLKSSKIGSKANFLDLKSSRVSSNVSGKKGAVSTQSSAKKSDSANALVPKGKQDCMDEAVTQAKDRRGSANEGNCPKDGAVDINSSDTWSDSSYASTSNVSGSSSINGAEPRGIASDVNNMSLTDKSGNSTIVSTRKTNSPAQYKPEKWMLPEKVGDGLTQLNLAIVGHVDSGKSTLSGRLLYLLGRISQKVMHKYEKEAKLQGKGSFAYAWALDESAEERERGITMTVAVAYFDSKKYHVVVLDSPGHKDFVPNMISGATQSDAAILVIDASTGAFEVGMDSTKGQTREHAQLIRSFGVDQLIVAVNKMDAVQYSKDRFESIKQQLGTFLRSCNFKDSYVSWIPISAMENQNLVTAPDVQLLSWYRGPCLLDAIDSLQPPTREFSKPLLMPICDVVKIQHSQVSACGKLEAGALRNGLKVLVMPSGEVGTVRSIERDSRACEVARAGDSVAVSLQGIDGTVMAGGVLCHPDFPVSVATRLELKVLLLDFAMPILIGSQLEFHIHHAKEAATMVKISSLLDTKTGKVIKKAPRCLIAKQSAVVEVNLHGPVCVEVFSNSRALGRVFLRSLGKTIAVGIVTRIIEELE
ncbi:hypothetical protein Q3G72_031599 [Acer saccharum]|nr:hypothetical protein Q3G72_031599 [Acer saccharum]